MKKNKIVISLKKVSKEYVFRHEKPTFIGSLFKLDQLKRFRALSGLSLEVTKGEKVGIIGSNGSGKTTLLKIISRITTETSGKVKTLGKIVSLIDLDAGFHPELSGRENIFLNGLVIGMSRKEIEEKIEEIIDFSGIREFIEAPLFTYSAGMSLRLGFSIAIHSNPDILILDEGISVGDEDFRKRSMQKIDELFSQGKTVVIVSHWLDFLQENCNRIVWLEKGKLNGDGGKEVIKKYRRHLKQ